MRIEFDKCNFSRKAKLTKFCQLPPINSVVSAYTGSLSYVLIGQNNVFLYSVLFLKSTFRYAIL